MFCPKCSQQQISDETNFCSRCGFQLNVVKALLTEDNQGQNAPLAKPDRSLRTRDMTVGALLMLFPAFFIAAIMDDSSSDGSGRQFFFLAVAWLVLSLLINIKPLIKYFLRAETSAPATDDFSIRKTVSKLISRNKKFLPAAHTVPASDFVMHVANTAEMVKPPSVTERTTNLLDRN